MTLLVESQGRMETLQGTRTLPLGGPARVTGPRGAPVRFLLGIPGAMHREYIGKLEVRQQGGELLAIVEMDRETAVASIVAAESSVGVPFEARKAQAIVTRSYLTAARSRHEGYDFCDTEHCQMLHEPQAPGTGAARAALATRGQVVVYQGEVVPALYSADCGGRTKSLAQTKWEGAHVAQPGYPFFSVVCPRRGHGNGHGVGLCQLGAIDLAKHGYSARIIVGHYFPDTTIEVAVPAVGPAKAAAPALPKISVAPAARALTASAGRGAHAAQ